MLQWWRLLGATVLAVIVGTASETMAGDVNSWTGFYVGTTGGYGLSRSNGSALPGDPNTNRSITAATDHGLVTGPVIPPLAVNADGRGWFAGALTGYNWQIGARGLLGLEADLSAADIAGSGASATQVLVGTTPATYESSHRLRWFGTLRGRAGFLPAADLLLYATGGLAIGGIDDAASLTLAPGQSGSIGLLGYSFGCGGIYGAPTCFAGSSSRTATGWTAGIGGEYRATQNVTLRFEYLYLDFGRVGYGLPALVYGTPYPSILNARADAAINMIRLGASYRF